MHLLFVDNLKTVAMLKANAEYNRKVAIIESVRADRSATEIIRFFGYPRSTVYDVIAKYNESEMSSEGSETPARKSHSKERVVRTSNIIERVQELIFQDPGQSIRKLSSVVGISEKTMRRIIEEDLRYKSYTIKVRQMLSDAARAKRVKRAVTCSCVPYETVAGRIRLSKEFWPPNRPDLNPLDFYVWSVVERVSNKSRRANVASLKSAIEAAFAGMDRDALKRACHRFRTRMEVVIKAEGGYIE
ncbi:uncharacterized protein LOC143208672 [Lasioglossum baleicum]|uniref:uncharacterized protein LOC143208672 n=1 Tax=Lasioglossum baleicum TaxID=434251 RepID=UPI003FCE078F